MLFGSDWPLFTEILDQRAWVEKIRTLEHPAALRIMGLPELTVEDKTAILGANAAGLLGF